VERDKAAMSASELFDKLFADVSTFERVHAAFEETCIFSVSDSKKLIKSNFEKVTAKCINLSLVLQERKAAAARAAARAAAAAAAAAATAAATAAAAAATAVLQQREEAAAKTAESTDAAAKELEAAAAATLQEVDSFLKKRSEVKPTIPGAKEAYASFTKVRESDGFKQRTDLSFTCVWDYVDDWLDTQLNERETAEDPFISLCLWIRSHCTIYHRDCRGIKILQHFLLPAESNCRDEFFFDLVALIRFCHLFRFWHISANFASAREASEKCKNLMKACDTAFQKLKEPLKVAELQCSAFHHDYFMGDRDQKRCGDCFSSKTQCIFELCYAWNENTVFDYCYEFDDFSRLKENMIKFIHLDCIQLDVPLASPLNNRWIFLTAGRAVKEWGHRSKPSFEQCEVEREENKCEKWRHQIYSYAIMSLLFDQFNGSKEGPLGKYSFREKSKLGNVKVKVQGGSGEENFEDAFVYGCKQNEKPRDYLGHNIVALAVCKRGSIMRVAYNHNVLFTSTVDHAEERLMDGLFKDPEAFVTKSDARVYEGKESVDIEKHMQHISIYTSLEPCQQVTCDV